MKIDELLFATRWINLIIQPQGRRNDWYHYQRHWIEGFARWTAALSIALTLSCNDIAVAKSRYYNHLAIMCGGSKSDVLSDGWSTFLPFKCVIFLMYVKEKQLWVNNNIRRKHSASVVLGVEYLWFHGPYPTQRDIGPVTRKGPLQIDRRLWKHNLASITVCGGPKELYPICPLQICFGGVTFRALSLSSSTPNPCSKWNYFAILNPQMSCLFLTDAGKLPPEVNFLSVYSLFFQTEEAIKL